VEQDKKKGSFTAGEKNRPGRGVPRRDWSLWIRSAKRVIKRFNAWKQTKRSAPNGRKIKIVPLREMKKRDGEKGKGGEKGLPPCLLKKEGVLDRKMRGSYRDGHKNLAKKEEKELGRRLNLHAYWRGGAATTVNKKGSEA